jgi:transcriptional regulator with XRE-family HTH domain
VCCQNVCETRPSPRERSRQAGPRQEFRREAADAFIANLKRLRKASGLSQENLSLRASLIRTHVGKIENGERLPQIDTVYRLAGALGVEPRELLAEFYWRPDEFGGDGHATDEPPKERYRG